MNTQTQTNEAEMREIFGRTLEVVGQLRDKVISQVVAHSSQASELERLKEQFSDLNQRFTAVINEAQQIRQNLNLVISERDKAKADLDEMTKLAHTYETERNEARELGNNHRIELDRSTHDLSQAMNRIERLEADNARVVNDRDYWQQQTATWRELFSTSNQAQEETEKKLKEAEDKLSRFEQTFRQIFPQQEPVSTTAVVEQPQDVHPVQQVGEALTEDNRPWWEKNQAG